MSNQEQLDILKQGVEVWNQWRKEHPEIRLDLSKADLSKANLSKADLSEAFLRGANLSDADLSGANLRQANLRQADLSKARLNDAQLYRADLNGAHLNGAHLSKADLGSADLSSAHLREVNLWEADLSSAYLKDADLGGASIRGAHLSKADLSYAHLSKADLSYADLSKADLSYAHLSDADLSYAHLSDADLFRANLHDAMVTGVTYLDRKHDQNTSTWKRFWVWLYPRSIMRGKYQGIHVASCYGNAIFKRDAQDQDFLDTLEEQWEETWRMWLFRAWGILDYGRSLLAVFLIAFLIVVGFGVIYLVPGIIAYNKNHHTVFSPFYFSIVTFTTLGFGDIIPNGGIGEIIVSLQVIFGYLTLGLLISIIANKVARRS